MRKVSERLSGGEREIVVARTLEEVEALGSIWNEMHQSESQPTLDAQIDRYLAVVNASGDEVRPYVLIFGNTSHPEAMIIGRTENHRLPIRLGYKTLLRPTLKCLNIVYGGILGQPTSATCFLVAGDLLKRLRNGEFDMVNFNHLRTDTSFYQAVREVPGLLTRDYFPVKEPHWKTSLPDSYEKFLSSRSKNTRHNIRRYVNRLSSKYGARLRIEYFSNEAQVDQLFKSTVEVAQKTYQHNLGGTFVDNVMMRGQVRLFVDRKLFKAYVLYIDDKPCAFWNGTRYGKTFFTWTTGYDPAFNDDRLGLFLLVKLIEALCLDQNVHEIDFGFGDAQYKQSFCDISCTEASMDIFAPRLYPILVNSMRSSVLCFDHALRNCMKRFGLTGWIKRRWRNLLQPKKAKSKHEVRKQMDNHCANDIAKESGGQH